MINQTDILLESGTNELEVVMFTVAEETFGINVLKVREIIQPIPITPIPKSHPNVKGVMRLREEVIPVIDLSKVLNLPPSKNPKQDKFIVSELNQTLVAFHVHDVSRIHRLSWEQIEKPNELSTGTEAYAIGIIKLEEEMALLLDFEKILVEINPASGVNVDQLKVLGPRERSKKQILIAEDSAVLREMLKNTLKEAGYEKLYFFENGQLAWDYLEKLAKEVGNPTEHIQLIITDIEMPQMDGHHLTSKVKNHEKLSEIPVVVFSSLITEDLYHKGKRVGASAQVTKPKIVHLVEEIDRHIL